MYPLHQKESRSLENKDERHKGKVDSEARSQSLEGDLQRTPINTQQCLTDAYIQKGRQPVHPLKIRKLSWFK